MASISQSSDGGEPAAISSMDKDETATFGSGAKIASDKCLECQEQVVTHSCVPCGHACLCISCYNTMIEKLGSGSASSASSASGSDDNASSRPSIKCPRCNAALDPTAGCIPLDDVAALALHGLEADGQGGTRPKTDNRPNTVSVEVVAPAPAPAPVLDLTVENDSEWIKMFGRSVFLHSALSGRWGVFRCLDSNTLYYVDRNDMGHTWDCPPEVAAEMKARAKAAAGDEYAYEGLGADFETCGPWVPPTVLRALANREKEVFAAGKAECCRTKDDEFAQLGTGVALYFRILRSFSILFLVLTLVMSPVFVLYYLGDRVTGNVPDPLGAAQISLGNVGPVKYDIILGLQKARAASNESTTSATSSLADVIYVTIPGINFDIDGKMAAYIITACDILACLIVLFTAAGLRVNVDKFTTFADRKKVSASDFTVHVRGLPPNCTVEEVRDHFSHLFALDGTGVSAGGAWDRTRAGKKKIRKNVGSPVAAVSQSLPAPDRDPATEPETVGAAGVEGSSAVPVTAQGAVTGSNSSPTSAPLDNAVDAAITVSTPPIIPADAAGPVSGSGDEVAGKDSSVNVEQLPSPRVVTYEEPLSNHPLIPRDPKKLIAAYEAAKKAVDRRKKAGIVTDADADASFAHRLNVLGEGTVADTSYNQDPSFTGSWVADVQLVRPKSNIIRAFLSAQQLTTRLREARAKAKMFGPDTPLRGGKGANTKLYEAAIKEVDSVGSQLQTLRDKLKKRAERGGVDVESVCAGGAFVTFNCEESYQRALKAYGSSHSSFMRQFQSAYMRFRHPATPGFHQPDAGVEASKSKKELHVVHSRWVGHQYDASGKLDRKLWEKDTWSRSGGGYRLWVQAAPDPSDVVHENLEVESESRCLRQVITAFISLLLVIAGLVIMVIAQGYSATLAQSEPDLSLCAEELPALSLRGYANVTDVNRVLTLGYGKSSYLAAAGPRWLRSVDSNAAGKGSPTEAERGARGEPMPLVFPETPEQLSAFYGRMLASSSTSSVGADALVTPDLTRLSDGVARQAEDDLCPADRMSVGYRYDFSDIPLGERTFYPSVPYPASAPTSELSFGSAVPYGALTDKNTCDLAAQRAAVLSVDPTLSKGPLPTDVSCPDPRVLYGAAHGFCPCVNPSDTNMCRTLPCFYPELTTSTRKCREFVASTIVGCYCSSSQKAYSQAKKEFFESFVGFARGEQDICGAFIGSYATAQSLIIISGLAATIVNMLLASVMPFLTALEGHSSLSSRSMAQSTKLAIAQTINTALTVLLVNARLPENSGFVVPAAVSKIGILNGQYSDFVTPWYGTVGTTILTTAISNTLVPPVLMSIEYIMDAITRCTSLGWNLKSQGGTATQAQMDELFVGARFNVAARYPLIITMISVSFVYSAGLPLLLPLASLAFALQYSVDKAMLVCFYRKPPAYDASLPRLAVSLLPYIVLVHTGVSLWMLSVPDLLSTDLLTARSVMSLFASVGSSGGQDAATAFDDYASLAGRYDTIGILPRILRLNTFPYFVLFIILLVSLALTNVVGALLSGLYTLAKAVTCGFVCCSRNDDHRMLAGARRKTSAKVKPDVPSTAASALSTHLLAFRDLSARLSAVGIQATSVKAGLLFEAFFVHTVKHIEGLEASALIPLALDGESTGRGKGLANFSGQFSRVHDSGAAGVTLAGSEVVQGWRLQELDASLLEDKQGQAAALDRGILLVAKDAGIKESKCIFGSTTTKARVAASPTLPSTAKGKGTHEVGAGVSTSSVESGPSALDLGETTLSSLRHAMSNRFLASPLLSGDNTEQEGATGKVQEWPAPGSKPAKSAAGCCGGRRSNAPSLFILRKLWTGRAPPAVDEGGMVMSAGHEAGQAKRTWEVIADTGITSYDLMRNPLYSTAFLAAMEDEDDAEDERGSPKAKALGLNEENEDEEEEEGDAFSSKASPSARSGDQSPGSSLVNYAFQEGALVDRTILVTAAVTGAVQAAAAATLV